MTNDWRQPPGWSDDAYDGGSADGPDVGSDRVGYGRAGRMGFGRAGRMAGKGRNRRILLGSAVLLCVIATGASLAAFASPGGSHAAAASSAAASGVAQPSASAASAPAATRPDTKGDGSNGVAKTALRWQPSEQNHIAAWKKGSGGAALSAVTAELGTATQTAAVRLYPDTRQACMSLGSRVATALAKPPIPDAAMQRMYATSLAELAKAATDCHSAISVRQDGDEDQTIHVNNGQLDRALTELASASKALYTATAQIRALQA